MLTVPPQWAGALIAIRVEETGFDDAVSRVEAGTKKLSAAASEAPYCSLLIPATFTIAPSGASDPFRPTTPPVGVIGLLTS